MRTTGAIRTWVAALAVCGLVLMSACGASPDGPAASSSPPSGDAVEETVQVPNLVGLPAVSVRQSLAAAGLALGATTLAPSDQPPDQVIAQFPAAGSAVSRGDEIVVIVSSGPAAPPTPTERGPDQRDRAAPSAPAPARAAGSALLVLSELRVAGRGPKTGYSRERFGQAWFDVDRNGCDTRNDILTRDLAQLVFRSATSCAVATGTLADPFTGRTIRFVRGASQVDIDHVVALSNAWVTGGARLSYSKRVAFANDPLNLLAVDASANRQKGDGDAATWLPSNRDFRCTYVARQIGVKAKYGLYVTAAERDAMQRVLASCPAQKVATGGGRTESGLTEPVPVPAPAAPAPGAQASDPDFGTCAAAKTAGKGPYVQGQDPEYDFYRDADGDGIVCE